MRFDNGARPADAGRAPIVYGRTIRSTHAAIVSRTRTIAGARCALVGPLGDSLTEPPIGEAGLVSARIDTDELVRARYDFDVVGALCARRRVLVHVDERPKRPVVFGASAGQGCPRAGRRPRESTRLRQRIGVSAIRM